MEPSIVAIIIVSVVFDRAIHLYRSDTWTPTEKQFTARRLLAGNHLPCGAACLRLDGSLSGTNHNDTLVRH
jgi:hypothetical protein